MNNFTLTGKSLLIMAVKRKIPVIDIFAGAGGLGEGFVRHNAADGVRFDVTLSMEMDGAACDTLRLRSFFHRSSMTSRKDYYRFLEGRMTRDELYAKHPDVSRLAESEVWQTELGAGSFSESEMDARIENALLGEKDWVLVGGPPCQAYSTIGRARNKSIEGYSAKDDKRHFLYEEYLKIISRHWPAVFILENVTGMLSSKAGGNSLIFDKIREDLSDPSADYPERRKKAGESFGYRIYPLMPSGGGEQDLFGLNFTRPADYVVKSELLGIPQSRHRVILLGIRDNIDVDPVFLNALAGDPVPACSVLADMPPLRSGINQQAEDSGEDWLNALHSVVAEKWFTELEGIGQKDVALHIRAMVDKIILPVGGRGADYVPNRKKYTRLRKQWPELYEWLVDPLMKGVCNSVTRQHMRQDLHRYLYVSSFARVRGHSPKLDVFPDGLLPDHANVEKAVKDKHFADRFRVQLEDRPSTTVVSHLSRDGHYFIHYDPSQCRSLTVREAARLQTFPDNYYFCGNRSSQYRQVGNAVPPLLSNRIAGVVADLLERACN